MSTQPEEIVNEIVEEDEIEEGEIGYIKKVHRDGTADVFWSICKKSATHKIGGGSGVHELKYAVYK